MMMKLNRWMSDSKGQSSIEYVLIAALIVLALVGTYAAFRGRIDNAFTKVGDTLETSIP